LGLLDGRHTVELDPNRVPADLGGAAQSRAVFVSGQEAGRADFKLTRLCQISGTVYVASGNSPSNERQSLAGVAVELSTGARTTTDELGRYSFTALRPGKYAVSIAADQTPSGLVPAPPTSWSFLLTAGEKASGADFVFLQREKPVIFGQLSGSS